MFLFGADSMKIKAAMPEWRTRFSVVVAAGPSPNPCRFLDILLGLMTLTFILPLMIVIAVAIKVQDGGPVLFGHTRVGRGGRAFQCWKFRSMVIDAEARLATLLASDAGARAEWSADHKLRRDPRVTPLGRFLRVTSIDELPQLLNVLKGDMSLVGPRPIVMDEVRRYGRWYRHYCAVRPGITGLWQVSGRNDLDYRKRVALDVLFARNPSVSRYISILAATAPAVVRRQGVY